MRVWTRYLMMAAVILMPVTAAAAPITPGMWSPIGTPDDDGLPFWDNLSDDEGIPRCPADSCNAGAVLLDLGYGPLEFLHAAGDPDQAVPFAFSQPVTWSPLFSATILTNGTPGQRGDGAITYDTNPGQPDNSAWNSLDDPGQFALFRQVEADRIRYFVAFEDIEGANSDFDYNDLIMTFTERRAAPEPATLLLFGTALTGVAARRLRRRR